MSDLSSLGAIGVVLMALIALFFKNQADKAQAKNILSDTKIEDAPLAAKQKELQDKIKAIDKTTEDKINEHDKMTDQEKADSWKKH